MAPICDHGIACEIFGGAGSAEPAVPLADPEAPTGVKPRLPQFAVLHREQYSAGAQSAAFVEYDLRIREFQREQAMTETDWTQQATNRVKTAASLHGRDRMFEALRNLGFALR